MGAQGTFLSPEHVFNKLFIVIKPRQHKQFFACNGKSLLKIDASQMSAENHMGNHPCASHAIATAENITEKVKDLVICVATTTSQKISFVTAALTGSTLISESKKT